MEDLIKRLEDTQLRVFSPTDRENIEEAIRYLKHYSEIKKIVDSWNSSDIAGDEQEVSQYFQQILDVFHEAG